MCERKEQLVAFIYDELEGSEGRGFEAHLRSCAECRAELADLRGTRGMLTSWAPPEPDFGFRIVRGAAAPPPPRFRIAPAWALAAAAVLVMAIGAAIANVELRYDSEGLLLRTGWNRQPAPVVAATGSETPSLTPAALARWSDQVNLLDRRMRELESTVARKSAAVQASGPRMSDADWRRVSDMVGQSETRQTRELALRIRQVLQDVDARRRTDLVAIQQGFGQLQGATAMEAAQHRDVMNYLKLVSQKQ
jgi:hypothetical protein